MLSTFHWHKFLVCSTNLANKHFWFWSQKEIKEDKQKAEQEGIAVTTARKPRPHEPETDRRKAEKDNFTVTVDLSKPTGVRCGVNLFFKS